MVDDRSPNVGVRLALQDTELYLHHRSLSRMDEICDRNVFCVILQEVLYLLCTYCHHDNVGLNNIWKYTWKVK